MSPTCQGGLMVACVCFYAGWSTGADCLCLETSIDLGSSSTSKSQRRRFRADVIEFQTWGRRQPFALVK